MAVRSKRELDALTTTTATEIYVCPTGFVAKVDKLSLSNTATTDNTPCIIYIGTSAAAGTTIIPSLTVPANDKVDVAIANHTLEAGDKIYVKPGAATNLVSRLSLVERTQP